MKPLRPIFAVSIVAAVAQAILLAMLAPDGGKLTLLDPAVYLFVVGPPLFLALLVWRRRAAITSPRSVLIFVLVLAAMGLVPLMNEVIDRGRNRFPNQPQGSSLVPLIVPLVQWLPVLAWWLSLVVRERRKRRGAG